MKDFLIKVHLSIEVLYVILNPSVLTSSHTFTDHITGTMALLSLGMLGNGAALITISLWNLNLGDEGSAKTLKMMTKVMLGFAGKSNTFFKNRHYSFLNYL